MHAIDMIKDVLPPEVFNMISTILDMDLFSMHKPAYSHLEV